MRVLGSLAPAPDPQRATVEVNVFPPQPEHFTLTQAERERYRPARTVASFLGRRDQPLHLRDCERFYFGLGHLGALAKAAGLRVRWPRRTASFKAVRSARWA